MKLLTKDLEEKLKEYPLGSQDGKLGNSKVIAKFFNPTGVGTWYIIEGKLLENGVPVTNGSEINPGNKNYTFI